MMLAIDFVEIQAVYLGSNSAAKYKAIKFCFATAQGRQNTCFGVENGSFVPGSSKA